MEILENNAKFKVDDKIGYTVCPKCESKLYIHNKDIIKAEQVIIYPGVMVSEYKFCCPCCNQIITFRK